MRSAHAARLLPLRRETNRDDAVRSQVVPIMPASARGRTADRYARIMQHVQWPLFVTLTAKHAEGDAMNIRQHRRAWGKLRRLRWFRSKVKGGVVAWEITQGDHGMHVHAHALFDCRWLSVNETAHASEQRANSGRAKRVRPQRRCPRMVTVLRTAREHEGAPRVVE